MNANDKAYFEGIVLNEGAYFYSYHNNIEKKKKKKNIKELTMMGIKMHCVLYFCFHQKQCLHLCTN